MTHSRIFDWILSLVLLLFHPCFLWIFPKKSRRNHVAIAGWQVLLGGLYDSNLALVMYQILDYSQEVGRGICKVTRLSFRSSETFFPTVVSLHLSLLCVNRNRTLSGNGWIFNSMDTFPLHWQTSCTFSMCQVTHLLELCTFAIS